MSRKGTAPLPQTCYPAVWLWPGQALYSGPALGLNAHSGSVWCLVVGVDAPVTISVDGRTIAVRSALVPPRLVHQLRMKGPLMSCYLDPTSARAATCRAQFTQIESGIAFDHAAQQDLLQPPADDAAARRWLDAAAPSDVHRMDPRIELAAKRIRDDPAAAVSAADLAAAAGLSESRFLHLFREQMGSSLRRYRQWCRLLHAGRMVGAGANLTTAAVESGFASPSHLADRFKSTFGLSATRLLATGLVIRDGA